MTKNYDKLSDEELESLHEYRDYIELKIATLLMEFESESNLRIDSISMYREIDNMEIIDINNIRLGDSNNIHVLLFVPIRINPE
jgi:hypothetical protein